jgi:lipoprotein
MKNGVFKKSIVAASALFAVVSLVGNVSAGSCPQGSLRNDYTNSISECNIAEDHAGSNNLMGTINTIISVVLGVLGILAVAYIIYGGFMLTTATGDPAKIKKARETIMYGVIGLVVALLAFAIVNFVLTSVFSGSAANGGAAANNS